MTENPTNLTDKTFEYFLEMVEDALNWNGTPLVDNTPKQNGYLTNLKKAGLVKTWEEQEPGAMPCIWLTFTEKGIELIKKLELEWYDF